MKKGMKKLAAVCAAIMLLFTGSIITGCELGPKIYEEGDFKYFISERTVTNETGKRKNVKEIGLDGLTEAGKQKEIIVVPSEIKGYPVTSLSRGGWFWAEGEETELDSGMLESENLKAIYLPKGIKVTAVKTFDQCPNLEKIVVISAHAMFPFPDKLYESTTKANKYMVNYLEDFKYLDENGTADFYGFSHEKKPSVYYANISYYYNYENADNEGFYWVDHFTYGEKIGYIPEEPKRTGYMFGGWYKEAECENIWNFEADILPQAKYDHLGDELLQKTKLYAKWIKE